jgi:hypothetical protein
MRIRSGVSAFFVSMVLASALPLVASCGGSEPPPSVPTAPAVDLDGDPIALLPPGAVVALGLDVHGLYASPAFGKQVAAIADSFLQLGSDAGFVPSRDLEQVTLASYSLSGDDVAVLRGHFDAKAIQQAAGKASSGGPVQTPSSGLLAATPYSGYTMYALADVGFAVLTPKTALAGSGAGLRRALDRIKDGHIRPELPSAMVDALRTLGTQGAVAAFAGDFSGASLASLQHLAVPPWVASVKALRATAALQPPGVRISGSVSFDSSMHASNGADGMRQVGSLVNTMAVAGVVPKLENLVVTADGANVQIAFALEDTSVRSLLQQGPEWLPKPNLGAARASNVQH